MWVNVEIFLGEFEEVIVDVGAVAPFIALSFD
jgi:hypothetical protein